MSGNSAALSKDSFVAHWLYLFPMRTPRLGRPCRCHQCQGSRLSLELKGQNFKIVKADSPFANSREHSIQFYGNIHLRYLTMARNTRDRLRSVSVKQVTSALWPVTGQKSPNAPFAISNSSYSIPSLTLLSLPLNLPKPYLLPIRPSASSRSRLLI